MRKKIAEIYALILYKNNIQRNRKTGEWMHKAFER